MKQAFLVLVALAFVSAGYAQEPSRAEKKRSAKSGKAHQKPTAEQIRKFNELEKKQHKAAAKP